MNCKFAENRQGVLVPRSGSDQIGSDRDEQDGVRFMDFSSFSWCYCWVEFKLPERGLSSSLRL